VEETILDSVFVAGKDNFEFVDDAFKGTKQPKYAKGNNMAGALVIEVGGFDNSKINGMSGAWRRSFSLMQDSAVEVSFTFKTDVSSNFDDPKLEYAETLASMDGKLVYNRTTTPGETVDFTKSSIKISGLRLSAGRHEMAFGLFLSQKTWSDEKATFWLRNVKVTRLCN
jgi:hypothetical protein